MRGKARKGATSLACAAFMLCCFAASAGAAVPADALGDLGDHRVVFPPYASVDRSTPSATATGVGDVDGDGLEDTAMVLDSYEVAYTPSAWVNFSPSTLPATGTAGGPGWSGFRIVGEQFWHAVAGLGDVNGDGLGEVVVEGRDGVLAVVFGRTDGQTVDIDDLGNDGYRITNVSYGTAIGFGQVRTGVAYQNQTVAAVGDQNADGRPDLAFRDGRSVKVVYAPPDPAGATIDSNALGNQGYTLSVDGDDPFVGRLGDLNGDGREEVGVMWQSPAGAYAASANSPGPGSTVDLKRAADEGRGFEVVVPEFRLENGIVFGDQNGDGRRDLGLSGIGTDHRRSLLVVNSPASGVSRVGRPGPGEGFETSVYDSNVIDVGDQDGDGRSDIAYADVVRLSGGSTDQVGTGLDLGGSLRFTGAGGIIIGSVADRNGDAKRELLTVHANPYNDEPGAYQATWMIETFLSAPTPVPELIEVPVEVPKGVDFGAIFETAPTPTRTLAARAAVTLRGPDGVTTSILAPELIDAGGGTTRAVVHADTGLAGLVPGRSYTYRLSMENGRGLVGSTASRSFVFRPRAATDQRGDSGSSKGSEGSSDGASGDGAPGASCVSRARARTVRLRVIGTRRSERLVGGPGRDLIRGRAGNDQMSGCGGADQLEGGSGADRLNGGRGRDKVLGGPGRDRIDARDGVRDRVSCGRGFDRALVDRGDRVTGCERITRRPSRRH